MNEILWKTLKSSRLAVWTLPKITENIADQESSKNSSFWWGCADVIASEDALIIWIHYRVNLNLLKLPPFRSSAVISVKLQIRLAQLQFRVCTSFQLIKTRTNLDIVLFSSVGGKKLSRKSHSYCLNSFGRSLGALLLRRIPISFTKILWDVALYW